MHSGQVAFLDFDNSDSDNEELQILLVRQETYLSSVSGIPFERLSSRQARWRPKIFEWFYRIIDHFGFDRDIVAISIDILDRYQLFHTEEMDGEMYQRAAMASLYISIKMHGCVSYSRDSDSHSRRIFSIDDYAELSRGQFSADDLVEMELCIFNTLNWKLNPVIPTHFLVPLLSLFPHDAKCNTNTRCISGHDNDQDDDDDQRSNIQFVLTTIYEVARYLIELSITSSEVTFYLNFGNHYGSNSNNNSSNNNNNNNTHGRKVNPSSVCYSALLISIDMVSDQYLSPYSREVFMERASMILHPKAEEIMRIRRFILESFVPEAVLDGSLTLEEAAMEIRNLQPSEILRNAGILSVQAQKILVNSLSTEHNKRKRKHPLSPTSMLDQDRIEDHN